MLRKERNPRKVSFQKSSEVSRKNMLRKNQVETALDQLQMQVSRLKSNAIGPDGKMIPPQMLEQEIISIENIIDRLINLIQLEDD